MKGSFQKLNTDYVFLIFVHLRRGEDLLSPTDFATLMKSELRNSRDNSQQLRKWLQLPRQGQVKKKKKKNGHGLRASE